MKQKKRAGRLSFFALLSNFRRKFERFYLNENRKVLVFALLLNSRRESALTGTGFLSVLFWRTMHVFLKSTVKITDIVVTTADCNAADGSNGS